MSRCLLSARRGHHRSPPTGHCLGVVEDTLRRTAEPRFLLVEWCGSRRTEGGRSTSAGENYSGFPTLIVPSSVLAITNRFKASVARPVTLRYSVCLFDTARVLNRLKTPGGLGPTSNFFRFSPDCMFHMFMSPLDVLAKQKFPHAEMHTA